MRTSTMAVICLSTVLAVLGAAPVGGGELTAPSASSAARIASARRPSGKTPTAYLASLSPAGRGDVRLDLELVGVAVFDHSIRTSVVKSLWQSGRHEEALGFLRTLEEQGLISGVGIGWLRPQSTAVLEEADVSVDERGGADEVALDYDPVSGNLFAVVRWGCSWSLFVSLDRGASWAETYHYSGAFLTGLKVDLEVHNSAYLGDHVYVAYSYNASLVSSTAKTLIRRFSAASGAPDVTWGVNMALSDDTRDFKEIALAITGSGTAVYTILRSDGAILCLSGTVADGSAPWFGETTGITDADRGLDVAYPGDGSNYVSLYISYIGTDDRVTVVRMARPTGFLQAFHVGDPPQPWASKTSVAAHLDSATVAWQHRPIGGTYQGVRSVNILEHGTAVGDVELVEGASWSSDSSHLRDPLVAASDSSLHNAIIYTDETDIIYREHEAYNGQWVTGGEAVNDHGVTPGEGGTFAFEWLGWGYGIAYHDSNGDVFFAKKEQPFSNSFDRGDPSVRSSGTR